MGIHPAAMTCTVAKDMIQFALRKLITIVELDTTGDLTNMVTALTGMFLTDLEDLDMAITSKESKLESTSLH